jgi:hypothetical protein
VSHYLYDHPSEKLTWIHEWSRGLAYLIERYQRKFTLDGEAFISTPPSELLVCYARSNDVFRTLTISRGDTADGIRFPTAPVWGTLVDPRSVVQGMPSLRAKSRIVWPHTRYLRARCLR